MSEVTQQLLPNSGEPQEDPVIAVYRKDVDVGLIRENLKLTVQQRIEQLMAMQHFIQELRRAGQRAQQV